MTHHNFTVTLTDAQLKALEYAVYEPQEWIQYTISERCRIAMEEIFHIETQRMLADPNVTQIPASVDEIVMSADIKSAKQRSDELAAETIAQK